MAEFKELGIPSDIVGWLQEATGENPSEFMRDDVLDMLGEVYNRKQSMWPTVAEYLREKKVLSTVFPEVKRVAREKLQSSITERRRRQVREKEDRNADVPINVDIVRMVKKGRRNTLWSVQIRKLGWIEDINTKMLLSVKLFKEVYFEAFSEMPDMPPKAWMWEKFIGEKSSDPDVTEFVETDDQDFLVDEVANAINALNVGDSPTELDHRKAYALPSGERCFTFNTIRSDLFHRLGYQVPNQQISSILHKLGIERRRPVIEGRKLRVYTYRYPVRVGRHDGEAEVVPLFRDDPPDPPDDPSDKNPF